LPLRFSAGNGSLLSVRANERFSVHGQTLDRLRRITVYLLAELGWCPFFANQVVTAEFIPARVARESHELYRIFCEQGEYLAELSGKFRHQIATRADLPAVGDWVLAKLRPESDRATIHRLLPRRGAFSRQTAGEKTAEQVVAANVDILFLVASLNREFNPRRIERYLTLAWESGARPVIVLNKSDLCEAPDPLRDEAEKRAPGVEVLLASAFRGEGISEIRAMVGQGITAAFLGSSGVGKSSLINALVGGAQLPTQPVRSTDDRGRHTTTSRQMLLLAGAGIVIDTPGLRELQLWDAGDGIGQTFDDIQQLSQQCKFRDCRHQDEPGCVVRDALDPDRLASYQKLQREEKFQAAKLDDALRAQRTRKLRAVMKSVNRFYRNREH
jgi:ribosome biogenesis GTPase / thiamine phosphate phosphatase